MAVDPAEAPLAADDLIARHGRNALTAAQERVDRASRAADRAALDLALMVLSEVERRLMASVSGQPSMR